MSLSTSSISAAQSALNVAIIGSGVAGLSAAAILRKYPQFSITIYERRHADFKESSAALGLRTNGISVLKNLGISREEIRAVVGAGYRTYNLQEEQMSESQVGDGPDGDGALWFVFRQDLKNALMDRVTKDDSEGRPIKVLYDTHIVGVEAKAGTVELADGTIIEADLIIGMPLMDSRAL
jgi:salicylate hydroxylase